MRNSDPPPNFTLRHVLSREYNGFLSSLRKLFLCKKAQNTQIRKFLKKSDLRNIRKTGWNELKFCNIVCIYQTFHLETILEMSWISKPHFQIRNSKIHIFSNFWSRQVRNRSGSDLEENFWSHTKNMEINNIPCKFHELTRWNKSFR